MPLGTRRGRGAKFARLAVAGVVVAAVVVLIPTLREVDTTWLSAWLAKLGPWAPVAFIAVYVVGTLVFFPGSILTLVGGAMFGPVLGTAYNLTGATLGAVLSFLIARYVAGDWATQRGPERIKRIAVGVRDQGWRFVAFTRLVPVFPFNFLNYAFGLTGVGLVPYTLASAVAMLPGAIAYTYLGHAGAALATGDERAIKLAVVAVTLLTAVSLLPGLVRRWKRRGG